jgi:hypothetical protein
VGNLTDRFFRVNERLIGVTHLILKPIVSPALSLRPEEVLNLRMLQH